MTELALPGNDELLLRAFARGDDKAFSALYERHKDRLYGYLYHHCHDEEAAAEMFQDVWLRVVSSRERYRDQGRFRAWLFTLAHHRLVDFYRARGRRQDDRPYDESAGDDNVEAGVESLQTRTRLEAVIAMLPLEQRAAFLMREEAGLRVKDIAAIQEITVEAAKSRLRYAYKRLRAALAEERPAGADR